MKNKIGSIITDFFCKYLSNEAGLSENTLKSYRDTFVLYIKYLEECGSYKLKNLDITAFTNDRVSKFLDWLESDRHCSVSTRNQRLAALKAFSNYVIRKAPENCKGCQDILQLRVKRAPSATIEYLPTDAIASILKQPNYCTLEGIRDLAILTFMYETGCRVQELIDAFLGDISFRKPNTVTLRGKGRKTRLVPISSNASEIIRQYVERHRVTQPDQTLFSNRSNKPLSRSGVAYILKKHLKLAKQVEPTIFIKSIHPHVFRHSKAMHLLESGVNLIYIRDFLGHSSVTTTEIYAKCNPELKRKYIVEAASQVDSAIQPYSDSEKDELLEWLKNNI
jgi:site-specific recombinase XerD